MDDRDYGLMFQSPPRGDWDNNLVFTSFSIPDQITYTKEHVIQILSVLGYKHATPSGSMYTSEEVQRIIDSVGGDEGFRYLGIKEERNDG